LARYLWLDYTQKNNNNKHMWFVEVLYQRTLKWGQSIDDSEKVVNKKNLKLNEKNRDEIIFIKSLIWSRVKVK
jgi:hypothetical protein